MAITIYQVDAFSHTLFAGNPAAVCLLEKPLENTLMQSIAEENNLSETAFVWCENEKYIIKWFTPNTEVALCGHATLAAAYVLFFKTNYTHNDITFHSKSGPLHCKKQQEHIMMDFPSVAIDEHDDAIAPELIQGLGFKPLAFYRSKQDHLIELDSEAQLKQIKPNLAAWQKLDLRGVIVTAPSQQYDFVSRCFYPKCAIPEDAVTGSAHCLLAPFWAKKLGKNNFKAKQISSRGGEVLCEVKENRVFLFGQAATYMKGTIHI